MKKGSALLFLVLLGCLTVCTEAGTVDTMDTVDNKGTYISSYKIMLFYRLSVSFHMSQYHMVSFVFRVIHTLIACFFGKYKNMMGTICSCLPC